MSNLITIIILIFTGFFSILLAETFLANIDDYPESTTSSIGEDVKDTFQEIKKLVDIAVEETIDSDEFAHEYKPARTCHKVDINNDGLEEYVVFYTVSEFGGGNNYACYAAIIMPSFTSYKLYNWFKICEDKEAVNYKFTEIEDGKLKIMKLEYLSSTFAGYELFDIHAFDK